ncbi:MAG: hypothetical protein ACYTXY_46675, partial [Nostoc sp.]
KPLRRRLSFWLSVSWRTRCREGAPHLSGEDDQLERRDLMSIEENVQIVKDFFAAMGGYSKRDLLALAAEDMNGSFQVRAGRWPARTAGTRNWRMCFKRRPKRWK